MTSNSATFDRSAALAAMGGNQQMLSELANILIEDVPDLLRELDQAVESGDVDVARRASHSLKGLTAIFYAEEATNLAHRIEHVILQKGLSALPIQEIERLKGSLSQLIEELRESGLAVD